MNYDKQKQRQETETADALAQRWQGRRNEKGESQLFWTELLTEVYCIEAPSAFICLEKQVKVDKTNFIDAYIPSTKVIIEQKSLGKDLRKSIPQGDGSLLTPFQQAKRYAAELPYSQRPRWDRDMQLRGVPRVRHGVSPRRSRTDEASSENSIPVQ